MDRTLSLAITLAFSDATDRTYTLTEILTTPPQIRQKVKAINANMPEAFSRTFVSNDGAQCTAIARVKFIATEESVIYNAS